MASVISWYWRLGWLHVNIVNIIRTFLIIRDSVVVKRIFDHGKSWLFNLIDKNVKNR